jgi:hypothetical protein
MVAPSASCPSTRTRPTADGVTDKPSTVSNSTLRRPPIRVRLPARRDSGSLGTEAARTVQQLTQGSKCAVRQDSPARRTACPLRTVCPPRQGLCRKAFRAHVGTPPRHLAIRIRQRKHGPHRSGQVVTWSRSNCVRTQVSIGTGLLARASDGTTESDRRRRLTDVNSGTHRRWPLPSKRMAPAATGFRHGWCGGRARIRFRP